MKNKKLPKFISKSCTSCGQSVDYDLSLDRGSALIVLAIYNAVRIKGENRVHLTNEMECRAEDFGSYREMISEGKMTSNMADNVLRAKYHGLVAQVDGGGRGEYLITPKGARFLRGERLPRVAVIDKTTHSKKAYWNEAEDTVTFGELLKKETPFWDLNDTTLQKLGIWVGDEQPTMAL